jgi:hypothetical protein
MHSGSPSQQLSAHEGATNNNLDPEGWQICAVSIPLILPLLAPRDIDINLSQGYSVSTSGCRGPADLQPFLSLVPVQGHIPMELEPPTTSVAASNQSHSTALMYQQFFHSDSLPGSPYPDAGPNQLSICPYSYPSSPVAQSQLEDESIPCTPSSQPSTSSRDPQGSRREVNLSSSKYCPRDNPTCSEGKFKTGQLNEHIQHGKLSASKRARLR